MQRSELKPIIYDYRDRQVDYLNKLFLKRNTYYKNLDRQATLFDDFEEDIKLNASQNNDINKNIRVAINDLDFHYGLVCFSYKLTQGTLLTFEIENEEIQPEFEVLKPYFSKILKSKKIHVHIQIGFDNETIVYQMATSADIDRINKETVDTVKFNFVEQQLKNKKPGENSEDQETHKTITSFFGSDVELINALLKNGSYVHQRQLYYLAKHHQHQTLKIRFVLHPFSFVFLLKGKQKFHVVLETLDTKEATYVWHISKEKSVFNNKLEEVNQKLTWIRHHGRQSFLDKENDNFSKIIHDYNDDNKGFYRWKNTLEQQLY